MITWYRHTSTSYAEITYIEVDDTPVGWNREYRMVRYNGTGARACDWKEMLFNDIQYCLNDKRWVLLVEPDLILTEGL